MHVSKKVKLYPKKHQKMLLAQSFGCVRFVFNQYINLRRWEYENGFSDKNNRKSFTEARSMIVSDNRKNQYPWLSQAPSASLQESVKQADKAYWAMVKNRSNKKKANLPKKRKSGSQSLRLPGKTSFKIRFVDEKHHRGHIYVPKIGWIKFHAGSTFPIDKVSSITVKHDRNGSYHASLTIEENELRTRTGGTAEAIGVDAGLTTLVVGTDTNGCRWDIPNPRFLRKSEKKIIKKQKALSRTKKGSVNHVKRRKQLAKAHKKIANQRNDFLHKISNMIANKNHVVVIESLNIAGMSKNHNLAKSISDASWAKLFTMLEYKCTRYGGQLVAVDRFVPTTKTCNHCKTISEGKPLSIRVWRCLCGETLDRDHNAATNILDAGGQSESLNACGEDVRRFVTQPLSSVKQEHFCKNYGQSWGDNPMVFIYSLKKKPRP